MLGLLSLSWASGSPLSPAAPSLPAAAMRGVVQQHPKIEYPAVRQMDWQRSAETPAPNFWSLDHDHRARCSGKSCSLYKSDRKYTGITKPASATDFYNIDQMSKASLAHKVHRSPYRYVSMRSESEGLPKELLSFATPTGTTAKVGPGSYSPIASGDSWGLSRSSTSTSPRGSSAFASGQARTGAGNFGLPGRTAEPGYATLAVDQKLWVRHANGQSKGLSFGCAQRWKRPPGPGSNLPAVVATPGPGTYGKTHAWPNEGFSGTARGFNHLGS